MSVSFVVRARPTPNLAWVTATWCALLAACSGESSENEGSVHVLLEAESTIIEGLAAGTEIEDIRDGWSVHYDRYLMSIGDVDLSLARDTATRARDRARYVVDLTKLGQDGTTLWTLDGLAAGRWNFSYRIGSDSKHVERHASVSAADFSAFLASKLTYSIAGVISKEHGLSCPPRGNAKPGERMANGSNASGDPCYDNPEVRFELPAVAEMGFGPCEIDGTPGVSVPAGGSGTVAATIHGDHLFFNGFPAGDEGGIVRLAQWLADCDLDLNAEVTASELQAVALADLPEIDDRYQLGSAPIRLATVWDLVIGQLTTQGHMDGEGECELQP